MTLFPIPHPEIGFLPFSSPKDCGRLGGVMNGISQYLAKSFITPLSARGGSAVGGNSLLSRHSTGEALRGEKLFK